MDVGQSRRFYRQGYLKIPSVIPPEKVFAARREIFLRIICPWTADFVIVNSLVTNNGQRSN